MIGSLVGSFGFKTTFSVSFARLISPPIGKELRIPLPTLVPIDRRFFEVDANVRMTGAMTADTFDLTIVGISRDIFKLLEPGKTIVTINLGYSDGGTADVMTGLLRERSLNVGDGFYEGRLSGLDYAFSRLQDPKKKITVNFKDKTLGQMASSICSDLGLTIQASDGPSRATQCFTDVTPLQALIELARFGDFRVQTKNGGVYFGLPDAIGDADFVPIDDDGAGDDTAARGAGADGDALSIVNFTIAGRPKLRPGDTVTIGSEKYRIETLNHEFKRAGSYVCTGRAVPASATVKDSAAASKPTAAAAAARLRDSLADRERRRSAVTAGVVDVYNDGHTTDVKSGLTPTPTMVTPSTQAPLRDDAATLLNKPIASTFAFDNCGLIAPVYPGMRALMVHGWHEPDDAVVDGFLWGEDMAKPANHPGDWWLHLPTQIGSNNRPTGSGVDDLIDKDGNRVIAVNGLRISVGAGNLNPVGTRPNGAAASKITIETESGGAKIELTNDAINLSVGSFSIKVTSSKVSIG